MEPKPLDLTDWKRIVVGSTDWMFLVEIVMRTVFIYVALMFSMRLLGRRISAQLSLFELSVVITLAGTLGVALQVPDRGLLPPLLILAVVIAFQREVARAGLKHRIVERIAAGDEALLVCDGRIDLEVLENSVLSREKVFAALRAQEVQHLGQVERLFLESSGSFSLVMAREPHPGLSVLPGDDHDLRGKVLVEGVFVCERCGAAEGSEGLPAHSCGFCGTVRWVQAVRELDDE